MGVDEEQIAFGFVFFATVIGIAGPRVELNRVLIWTETVVDPSTDMRSILSKMTYRHNLIMPKLTRDPDGTKHYMSS